MKKLSQLALLLIIWGGCFMLTGVVAFGVITLSEMGYIDYGEGLRVSQWLQSLFVMILPPLLWVRYVLKEPVRETLQLTRVSWKQIVEAIVMMALLVPAIEWIGVASYQLPWPEGIRTWAESQAQTQGMMMGQMLDLPGVTGFLRIMLLVSLMTAVGEELLFRGALMRLLGTQQILWVAVLIGFVFALVHLEVYGFLSRWLLGSLFVYLVYWTKSLWPAVAAHATNNLVALIEFRIDDEVMMTSTTTSYFPLWTAVAGAVAAVLMMELIRRSGKVGVEA